VKGVNDQGEVGQGVVRELGRVRESRTVSSIVEKGAGYYKQRRKLGYRQWNYTTKRNLEDQQWRERRGVAAKKSNL